MDRWTDGPMDRWTEKGTPNSDRRAPSVHGSRFTCSSQYPSCVDEPLAQLLHVWIGGVVELLHRVAAASKCEVDEAPVAERDGDVRDVSVHPIREEEEIA